MKIISKFKNDVIFSNYNWIKCYNIMDVWMKDNNNIYW